MRKGLLRQSKVLAAGSAVSPVRIDDVLLVLSDAGEVALVEASPEKFREITRYQAIEGKTWNHPVYCRGRLLVRNAEEAACIDMRPDSTMAEFP